MCPFRESSFRFVFDWRIKIVFSSFFSTTYWVPISVWQGSTYELNLRTTTNNTGSKAIFVRNCIIASHRAGSQKPCVLVGRARQKLFMRVPALFSKSILKSLLFSEKNRPYSQKKKSFSQIRLVIIKSKILRKRNTRETTSSYQQTWLLLLTLYPLVSSPVTIS